MPYPMISETQKVGYDAERRFMDYMINVGFDAFKAPNVEDKNEHWDIHLMTKIDAFATEFMTNVTPGFGAPSPQIVKGATQLKADVKALKPRITEVKSKRIFGE